MLEESPLKGKKILIVDDEPDVLDTLEQLLSMCQVEKASTFDEARILLESQDFDLTILDIMGVDGYKLLEMTKKKSIPAVMLTAHAFSPENLVKSIKEGADSYLPKEELNNITTYLIDVLKAKKEKKSPWGSWHEKLPSSYFEKRWGAAWQDKDKDFWEQFKASIKAKKKS